jgi:hypothetical protein
MGGVSSRAPGRPVSEFALSGVSSRAPGRPVSEFALGDCRQPGTFETIGRFIENMLAKVPRGASPQQFHEIMQREKRAWKSELCDPSHPDERHAREYIRKLEKKYARSLSGAPDWYVAMQGPPDWYRQMEGSSLGDDTLDAMASAQWRKDMLDGQRALRDAQQHWAEGDRTQKWIMIGVTASIPVFGAIWRALGVGRKKKR